jgi:metal-responsive CopG/Arc/MetJ family transcriptional regulator
MPKIKIDDELMARVKELSEEQGYSSVEEFVAHVLEAAVTPPDAEDADEDVMERLKGLGYIS